MNFLKRHRLHDANRIENSVPFLARNAAGTQHGRDDSVVKPGRAIHANTPLGREVVEDPNRQPIVRKHFGADFLLEILTRQTESLQFRFGPGFFIERSGRSYEFPSLACMSSLAYRKLIAPGAP